MASFSPMALPLSMAVKAQCAVCGDKATRLRYSHYGATSCFSCRAFFRRALEKGSSSGYACVAGSGACVVAVASRKRCPHCRFQKCVAVGMRHKVAFKESAASDECPVLGADNAAELLSVSSVALHDEELRAWDVGLVAAPDGVFTADDALLVRQLVKLDRMHSFPITEVLKDATRAALKSFIKAAVSRSALDFSAIAWAYTMGIKKLTRFAHSLPEFAALKYVEDKKALLLHNLDPMFNVRMGHFFTCGAEDFLTQSEQLEIFDFAMLKSLCQLMPVPRINPLRWDQFFKTPWANSAEHEQQYEALMARIGLLRLDAATASLMTIVALFSTDSSECASPLPLVDAATVSILHSKYQGLLYRYLRHTRGSRGTDVDFPNFVAMSAGLRQMSDIMKHKTIKLNSNDPWPQLAKLLQGKEL